MCIFIIFYFSILYGVGINISLLKLFKILMIKFRIILFVLSNKNRLEIGRK